MKIVNIFLLLIFDEITHTFKSNPHGFYEKKSTFYAPANPQYNNMIFLITQQDADAASLNCLSNHPE